MFLIEEIVTETSGKIFPISWSVRLVLDLYSWILLLSTGFLTYHVIDGSRSSTHRTRAVCGSNYCCTVCLWQWAFCSWEEHSKDSRHQNSKVSKIMGKDISVFNNCHSPIIPASVFQFNLFSASIFLKRQGAWLPPHLLLCSLPGTDWPMLQGRC